jgi:hypothetical protein
MHKSGFVSNQPAKTCARYGMGAVKIKSVGNNLNTTTFSYNERGWLKTQDNDQALFSEVLWYNNPVNSSLAQYNGNIANQVYTNGSISNTFNYSYDKLNRLTTSQVSRTGASLPSERDIYKGRF